MKNPNIKLPTVAMLCVMTALIIINIVLVVSLKQSWRNERALSESVNQLTPKWP